MSYNYCVWCIIVQYVHDFSFYNVIFWRFLTKANKDYYYCLWLCRSTETSYWRVDNLEAPTGTSLEAKLNWWPLLFHHIVIVINRVSLGTPLTFVGQNPWYRNVQNRTGLVQALYKTREGLYRTCTGWFRFPAELIYCTDHIGLTRPHIGPVHIL